MLPEPPLYPPTSRGPKYLIKKNHRWAFEIVALVAGRLGTIPLAAQSVIMTTDQVLNTIPFGIGVAASSRVGNLLGSRDAAGARRAANVAAWLSVFMGILVLAVLMGVKDNYARIFNDDEGVVKLTAKVMPFVALFQIADGLNGSCGGSLRGQGRQHIGAAVNIVSYYCGALPLGIWLAFHGWGLEGLWVRSFYFLLFSLFRFFHFLPLSSLLPFPPSHSTNPTN